MVIVNWTGEQTFVADTPTGSKVVMDAYPEVPGTAKGATPVETFLSALAACTAMDVISILEKKRQTVTSYRVEIDGERGPQGEFPRPFLSIKVRHILTGDNIDPAAVQRAVELSDEKYCSISATLRESPKIVTEWTIEEKG
jgi:putative redox protein